ncbi:MAG: hypothetical protein B7Z81_00335 [Acidocella sp. 20-61-6]|nr:MAG: hypothetical protein B7Z81_00335 [Acidocella sp. 20-61-6]
MENFPIDFQAEVYDITQIDKRSEVVLTLGMHRSGTSALTGALGILGLKLGNDLMPAGPDNPKGFFEHKGIVEINDAFSWERASSWDNPRFPLPWASDAPVAKIENLLKKDFGGSCLWGLKDPRISVFLPSYIPILERLTDKIHPLLMLRSPIDVAASLAARDNINEDQAAALWISHTLLPLRMFAEQGIVLVSYDALIDGPGELERVAKIVGLPSAGDQHILFARAHAFLGRDLRHHRSQLEDVDLPPLDEIKTNLQLAMHGFRALKKAYHSNSNLTEPTELMELISSRVDREAAMSGYLDRKLPSLYGTINALKSYEINGVSGNPPPQLTFFTICARNYMAFADVLGQSLASTYPGSKLTIFLMDGVSENNEAPDYLILRPIEGVLPKTDWMHRQAYYDVLECSTSVKPACFLKMFEEGHGHVVYLDPDIYVFRPLHQVAIAFAEGAEVVLTPHVLSPYPEDLKRPEDLDILRAGTFNLGFAAFRNSERGRYLLGWWNERLKLQCLSDVREGTFTDQKWMDFIPSFEQNIKILRNPGYNMAYWNLHERDLIHTEYQWSVKQNGDVNPTPLTFYHFSGFDPNKPELLSKHQNRITSENLSPTLLKLLEFYAGRLKAADYDRHMPRGIAPLRFATGENWDVMCRSLYRISLQRNFKFDSPLTDPAFISWISSYASGDHIPRYLRQLFTLRGDVAMAFNEGHNLAGLINWLRRDGKDQLGVDEKLLARIGLVDPQQELIGVNYVGYLTAHLGVGEAARNTVEALAHAGITISLMDISEMTESPRGDYDIIERFTSTTTKLYPITILHVNADQLPYVLANLPANIHTTTKIGVWAWESSEFPDKWCDRFDLLDEVWVGTKFMADSIAQKATVPVFTVPYVIKEDGVKDSRDWLESRVSDIKKDEFVFLFQFDAFSIPYRKNPHAAVKAFLEAFTHDMPVRLLIKTINGKKSAGLIDELKDISIGGRVTFWDESLSSEDRFKLLASIDSFVSLHRAEGFGLSIAEAMLLKKPVLVTNWSGNVDFTTPETAALVDYTLKPLTQTYGPYDEGTIWADPSISDAAMKMRRIFDDASYRIKISENGAQYIANILSTKAIGKLARDRLQRVIVSKRKKAIPNNMVEAAVSMIPVLQKNRLIVWNIGKDAFRRPHYYVRRIPAGIRAIRKFGLRSTITMTVHSTQQRIDVCD